MGTIGGHQIVLAVHHRVVIHLPVLLSCFCKKVVWVDHFSLRDSPYVRDKLVPHQALLVPQIIIFQLLQILGLLVFEIDISKCNIA